jgi:serine carboxypeptidase-like clade 1
MFGMLAELGPLLLNDNSLLTEAYNRTNVPSLFYNDYSWSKVGNLLIFDWPPPTGFSYCNGDPSGDGYSCGDWSDSRMAKVSYAALEGFFDIFPELLSPESPSKSGGLFLTGESYGGVYIPKLAQEIIGHGKTEAFNLQGIAVGDACAGTDVLCGENDFGNWWNYLFLYGHHQISTSLWSELISTCGVEHLQYTSKPPIDSGACDAAVSQVDPAAGGYYVYSLYDECTYDNSFRRRNLEHVEISSSSSGDPAPSAAIAPGGGTARSSLQGGENDYVCGGGPVQTMWTDQEVVRKALHVPLDSNFLSGDNADGMNYDLDEKNLMPFYQKLALGNDLDIPHIRVMIYNGDTDPMINSFNAQNWTSHLGLLEKEAWRPWTMDACQAMGGYVTEYEGEFSFATIRGSGHMVPQYKAPQAFTLISNFVQNKKFAPFVASCQSPPQV